MLDPSKPLTRATDGEKGEMWHYIHDHEKRMQLLERDSHDIKESMQAMKLSLALANKSLDNLESKFDARLTSQFLLHESRESANQRRTLTWTVGILLAALGGFAAWFMDKVTLVTGG